jgi:hypothetical protein
LHCAERFQINTAPFNIPVLSLTNKETLSGKESDTTFSDGYHQKESDFYTGKLPGSDPYQLSPIKFMENHPNDQLFYQ